MSAAVLDAHQHFLTEPLLEALERRQSAPRALRRDGTWTVELAGEEPFRVDPASEDVDRRGELMRRDGIDSAVVGLSSVLGVESLPADEASELIAAHAAGMAELPAAFASWGAAPLADPDPAAVDEALARGAVGLSMPAGALAGPAELDRCGALLERLERADAPLFVHPGPSPWRPADEAEPDVPSWWPALTRYVAQMNTAWHAFLEFGRPRHPELRVLFAMLAGCAPLHAERLAARGGPAGRVGDERLFYDLSSYGPAAIDAVAGIVGTGQLVYGSDRPVAEPVSLEPGVFALAAGTNPTRLFSPTKGALN